VNYAARVEARIKQLCCLGLGGEAVMPALVRELRQLIPAHGNTFFWAGENYEMKNVYDDNPGVLETAPLYFEEFHNKPEREMLIGFTESMQRQAGIVSMDEAFLIDERTYRKSDHYNLLHRPLGYDNFLRLVVRENGRALGALHVWRSGSNSQFTRNEERCLLRLQSFIAHALTAPKTLDAPLVDSGEAELIVADGNGKPLYLSRKARRLLTLATHPRIGSGSFPREPAALPAAVVRICQNLVGVFTGEGSAEPPVYHHRNAWGGFTFRAYKLDPTDTSSSVVGVVIEHQEPLPVRLMRGIGKLPLSARQAEVCFHMASGLSYNEIAKKLHISPHTAVAHSRWIYDRLGVGSRTELVEKLLANDETGEAWDSS
jgi:DNA-binding CsgD family transcriptional regulator